MPLFWTSLSFAAGILLGAWTGLPWAVCLAGGLGGVGLAFLASRLPFPHAAIAWKRLPALGLAPVILWAGLALGAARCHLAQPAFGPETLASHNGQGPSLLRGVIAAHPDVRDQAVFLRVDVSEIARVGETPQPTHGTLLVRAAPAVGPAAAGAADGSGDWAYGDAVEITGAPEAPPETADFSYREYLSRQGVYTYLAFASIRRLDSGQGSPLLAAIYALQDRALEQVNRLYPPPESALLAGILLGNDNAIPESIQRAFKNTGTAHIVAISGFNIAILAGLFSLLFTRLLGRWRGAALAAVAVIFYTVLVGAGASVVRAAIMGCVGLLGQQIGRRQVGLNTLAFTSAAMCLVNPFYLWDVSFQLSFMATLGLVLYAGPLEQGFLRLVHAVAPLPATLAGRAAGLAGELVLFTLAAQITTLPLMAFHFGQVSWIAFLANPLVLPPQPLVMVLGGLAVLLSWVWFPLGQALAALAWPFVAYTIRMVEAFGQIPHGSLTVGQISLALVAAYYLVLFGWTFLRARLASLAGQVFRPALVLAALFALACLVWRAGMGAPDGRLHLLALDTGSEGSFLVTTPGGRAVLINGGASFNQLSDALGRRLPLFDSGLDLLVVSARGNADLDALPRALEQFPVRAALWGGDPGSGLRAAQALRESLDAGNVPVMAAQAGEIIDLGQGAVLRVLSNDSSGAAFLLEWNGFRALLPLGEGKDLPEVGEVQVLLLPKNTPQGEQTAAWIAAINPKVLLGEVPAELEEHSALSTERYGWIDISTDGEQMWLNGERK